MLYKLNRHTFKLLIAATLFSNVAMAQTKTTESGIAVLELFTSKGCSSCPPADSVLANIAQKYPEKVVPLSFHVDYWDRLGWKDTYSSAAFSLRQYQYASASGSGSVFTPEVVVNGTSHLIGSQQERIEYEIKKALAIPLPFSSSFDIKASKNSKKIAVSYQCPGAKGQLINIALVQRKSSIQVGAGENKGRRLQHTNIVRELVVAKEASGTARFTLPDGLSVNECAVVIYGQDPKTMAITSATELIPVIK